MIGWYIKSVISLILQQKLFLSTFSTAITTMSIAFAFTLKKNWSIVFLNYPQNDDIFLLITLGKFFPIDDVKIRSFLGNAYVKVSMRSQWGRNQSSPGKIYVTTRKLSVKPTKTMFKLSAKYLAVKLLYRNKGPFIKVLTFKAFK